MVGLHRAPAQIKGLSYLAKASKERKIILFYKAAPKWKEERLINFLTQINE